MNYCKRCVYPENTRPYIIFDEEGVCSGCRVHESRLTINWDERKKWFDELIKEIKAKAKENKQSYDCIIPVSGGKDSHWQTYLLKVVYGLNPLLVCYNHGFNTKRGIRNLTNLSKQFDVPIIRWTTAMDTARKISKYMVKRCGDMTWHYHCGIMTFPMKMAVAYKIPFVMWGEHGFADLMGMFNQEDMVEFSKKVRREHSIRGIEAEDIASDPESGVTMPQMQEFVYPSDEDIERVGVRGIYLSNYFFWDARRQVRKMIDEYEFETAVTRERTFHLYDKLDDIHADGAHDYCKYLKFGYGRATDDASMEVRHRRMTREEAIDMVEKYDHVRPTDLDIWLRFVGTTEAEFLDYLAPMRDKDIWARENGEWVVKDSVVNHKKDEGVDKVRLELLKDREPYTPSKQPVEDIDYTWL